MKGVIAVASSAALILSATTYSQISRADDELSNLNQEAARLASQVSCMGSYKVGDLIMGDRQAGITLPDEMEHHKDREFLHELIDRAYTVPLFQTEEAKKRAIQEFAEKEYNNCKKLLAEAKAAAN